MPFIPDPADPFYDLMQPPADETPSQKTARKKRELDAQRRNDAIDKQINQDRANSEKEKQVVKILLLGQSESGKSTMLKNLRMQYAQEEWERERHSWRIVVLFNVVQSINAIVRVVESEMNGGPVHSDDKNMNRPNDAEAVKFTDRHQFLLIRLAPLLAVEAELKLQLGIGSHEYIPSATPLPATPVNAPIGTDVRKRRSSVGSWKDILNLVRLWQNVLNPEPKTNDEIASSIQRSESISDTIATCKDDMKSLWQDETVRVALKCHRIQLDDNADLFLDDLDRVTAHDYVVTNDDIIRARLQTVGIQEHRIYFKQGPLENPKRGQTFTREWRIFDIGGCRTKREAWLPYFDNVNVVTFFSPISVFDQRLEEDPSINRLEDSIILWTSICSSTLLTRTQLILFFTKCDLLRQKLKRGVQLRHYLPSYGDRPNELMAAVKYFREKFKEIAKKHSVEPRSCSIFQMTVIDTRATETMLHTVRHCILRENLTASQLI